MKPRLESSGGAAGLKAPGENGESVGVANIYRGEPAVAGLAAGGWQLAP